MQPYLQERDGFWLLDNSDINNYKHPVLIHDDNKFYYNSRYGSSTYWKCAIRGCDVRVQTNNDLTELTRGRVKTQGQMSHDHLHTWTQRHADRAWSLRTLLCCRLDLTSRREFDQFSLSYPTSSISAFPKFMSVKRKILEMRKDKPPPTPSDVAGTSK